MAISDYLKVIGPMALKLAMEQLDGQNDEKTRELMKQAMRKLVATAGLSKDRMRRLATLLAEAASVVAEELK